MRLDHIAFRVHDRKKAVEFIKSSLGYTVADEFDLQFDDGSTTKCYAMSPPEKQNKIGDIVTIPWIMYSSGIKEPVEHHLAPEIFVSEGDADSIVGKWVESRGGSGGIHHIAYQVSDIDQVVAKWRDLGVEFLSEEVIECPEDDLRQIFTKPLALLGDIIIEMIERGEKGFCRNSVKDLMNSTKEV
tara:strand:- start:630 stop:1187 length:558 start_codon:yes stop_codon:yes gene_type:complete